MKLTMKQARFCHEYMIDLNATQAAIRSGYSKRTAQRMGSENLSKPLISAEISRLQAEIGDKTSITIENTVNLIKDIVDRAFESEDHSNALKGSDMLMKYLGGYEKDKLLDIKPIKQELIFQVMPKVG